MRVLDSDNLSQLLRRCSRCKASIKEQPPVKLRFEVVTHRQSAIECRHLTSIAGQNLARVYGYCFDFVCVLHIIQPSLACIPRQQPLQLATAISQALGPGAGRTGRR